MPYVPVPDIDPDQELSPRPNIQVLARHLGHPQDSPAILGGRCVGKSTSLVLDCISRAMRNPGVKILIKEERDLDNRHTRNHNEMMVSSYLQKLGFVGFKIGRTPDKIPFVQFNLWVHE